VAKEMKEIEDVNYYINDVEMDREKDTFVFVYAVRVLRSAL